MNSKYFHFLLLACAFCEVFESAVSYPEVHRIVLKYNRPRRQKPHRTTKKPRHESAYEESTEENYSSSMPRPNYYNSRPYKHNHFNSFEKHSEEKSSPESYSSESFSKVHKKAVERPKVRGNLKFRPKPKRIPARTHRTPMKYRAKDFSPSIDLTTLYPQRMQVPIIDNNFPPYYNPPAVGFLDSFIVQESNLIPKTTSPPYKFNEIPTTFIPSNHKGYQVYENTKDDATPQSALLHLSAFAPVLDAPLPSISAGISSTAAAKVEGNVTFNETFVPIAPNNNNHKVKRTRGQSSRNRNNSNVTKRY